MSYISGNNLKFIPASHEDLNNPRVLKKILLDRSAGISGNLQMVNWAIIKPNDSFKRHYHEDMTEVFLLVSGKVEMIVGNNTYTMEKGDLVLVPPMTEHQMTNISEISSEYIVFGVSSGMGGKTINV
jgi:mannose-6-phosphate isomerase-like protein (cupin superfamily)